MNKHFRLILLLFLSLSFPIALFAESFTNYDDFLKASRQALFTTESFSSFPKFVESRESVNGVRIETSGGAYPEGVSVVEKYNSFTSYSLARAERGFNEGDTLRLTFSEPIHAFGVYINTVLEKRYVLTGVGTEIYRAETSFDTPYDTKTFQFLGIVSDTPLNTIVLTGGAPIDDVRGATWAIPRFLYGRNRATSVPLLNGSFEEPLIPNLVFENIAEMPEWTLLRDMQIHGRQLWAAAEGEQHVEFNAAQARITRLLDVTPGEDYLVKFSFAGNPDRKTQYGLDVKLNNDISHYAVDSSSQSRDDIGWRDEIFPFHAESDRERLIFQRNDRAPRGAGPLLDDVQIYHMESQSWTLPDFFGQIPLILNGNAQVLNDNDRSLLRLVTTRENQIGSAFSDLSYVGDGFSTFFQFRISNPGGDLFDCNAHSGADGIVFTVQSSERIALGRAGNGIGYAGIPKSLGIEFDTWCNAFNNDPSSNHVGIQVNGSVVHGAGGVNAEVVEPDFDNGEVWSAWVDYDGVNVELRISENDIRPERALVTRSVDLRSILGNTPFGYVGLTSATGAAYGDHDILRMIFRSTYSPIPSLLAGDFNLDFSLDPGDLEMLANAVRKEISDSLFDLNQDGTVDSSDYEYWILTLKQIPYGDANFDGHFNSSDIVKVFTEGRYESEEQGASWESGDWNGDGKFDTADIVLAFQEGRYEG